MFAPQRARLAWALLKFTEMVRLNIQASGHTGDTTGESGDTHASRRLQFLHDDFNLPVCRLRCLETAFDSEHFDFIICQCDHLHRFSSTSFLLGRHAYIISICCCLCTICAGEAVQDPQNPPCFQVQSCRVSKSLRSAFFSAWLRFEYFASYWLTGVDASHIAQKTWVSIFD